MATVSETVSQAYQQFQEFRAFIAERIETDASTAYLVDKGKKRKSLEKRGKSIIFEKQPQERQQRMMQARLQEWLNYKKFNAVTVISRKEADEQVANGDVEELPMMWVETDKNDTIRAEQPMIEEKLKARLVARGDLSTNENRTDSPTADNEAVMMVCSWASSRRLKIRCGDLDHGYFQGEELTWPLVLRQPKGGCQVKT